MDTVNAWGRAREALTKDPSLSDEEKTWLQSSTPEALLQDIQKYNGQHADKSLSRKALNTVKPIIHTLEFFAPSLDVFAQADPQGVLTLVWGSIRMLLAIANKFIKYFNDVTTFIDRIFTPLGRLQEYEKLVQGSDRLATALYGVFAKFLNFALNTRRIFLDKTNRASILDRFGGALRKGPWHKYAKGVARDVSEIKLLCEEAREEADLALSQSAAAARKKADDFYQKSYDFYNWQYQAVEDEKADRANEKLRQIVSWLDPLDMRTVLNALSKERYHDTCEWLFENETFGQWISLEPQSGAAGLLWIHARPGAGKTFLVGRCIELLREIGMVAYFFCDTKVQKRRDAISVVRTWVHQLLVENPGRAKDIEDIFYKTSVPSTDDLKDALTKLLANTEHTPWFVLDGLDECEPQARADLLNICENLVGRAKILLSSRKENDIAQRLSSLNENTLATIVIDPEDNCKDIESFVEGKVEEMDIDDEQLEETVIQTLTQGANGMFLWVSLMIVELQDAERDENLEEALENLPDGLDELYARILDRINGFRKASKRETARQLLQWIACAMEPLTVSELEHALAITPDEKAFNAKRRIRKAQDFILETCGPLVEISKPDQIVKMAHASVKDFLLSKKEILGSDTAKPQLSAVTDYLVDGEEAHTRISLCCLTYLCYPSSHYVEVGIDRAKSHASLEKRLELDVFLKYATLYWWRHVLLAPNNAKGLAKTLGTFLTSEEAAVYWLQIFHKLRGDSHGNGPSGPNQSVRLFTQLVRIRAKWHTIAKGDTWIDNLRENIPNWCFRFYCFLTSEWFSYFLPIQIASFFDFHGVVRKELHRGVRVDACNDRGDTALFSAARGDSVATLGLLLQAGADVNWIGDQKETAFHRAVSQYGLTEQFQIDSLTHECAGQILKAGINVSQVNFAGDRFVHYLCRRTGERDSDIELLRNVLDHGGTRDLETCNNDGVMPLHIAAYNSLPRITSLLLERGADPNGGTQTGERLGRTPLQAACKTRNPRIARILIQAGADPNIADPVDRRTPLHSACQLAPGSVSFLLEAGADSNLKDNTGSTPLHYAARENRASVISALINHGGSLSAKDSEGRNPLDVAIEEDAVAAIELLKSSGATSRFTSQLPRRPTVEPEPSEQRYPKTERDIMAAYFLLRSRLSVPHSYLVRILDYGEYWVRTVAIQRASATNPDVPIVVQEQNVGPAFVASKPVAGLLTRPVVRVVFRTRSHDQGHSDFPHLHGTYEGSWSGFRARILRGGREKPEGHEEHILVNRHAVFAPKVHVIEWTRHGGGRGSRMLRELGSGDVIQVVPYAQYLGWVNFVYAVSVEVFTSCFILGETKGF